MNESASYQDWQIRQADQAVRLYFSNFLMSRAPPSLLAHDSSSIPSVTQQSALQSFRENLRLRNYATRTEQTYLEWVRRYFSYCQGRSPTAGKDTAFPPDLVRDYLAHLAVERNVSASTQNLAFNSLLQFYRLVFNQELGDLKNAVRAKTSQRLPVVFSAGETSKLLSYTEGTIGLMLKIIYGGGLRVSECCRLRIKDIDFSQQLIFIRDGKGGKDQKATLFAGIMSVRVHFSAESKMRYIKPAYISTPPSIPCATLLPRTCCSTVSICARSRNISAIRRWKRQ
jgi:integrase